MNNRLALSEIMRLVKHRNIFLAITAFLLISNLGLIILLGFSREKTIVVPARVEKSFWVQGGEFSKEYIEQISLYYLNFLLNKHRSNIKYNHDFILKYTASSYYGELKKKLFKEAQRLEEENLTTTFYPKRILVNTENLSCEVSGLFQGMVGSSKVVEEEITFIIQFAIEGGIPMISQFKRKGKENDSKN